MSLPATVTILTDDNFQAEVLDSNVTVLVATTAGGRAEYEFLKCLLAELAVEYNNAVKVGIVDMEMCREIAEHYGRRSIPTFFIFERGEIVDVVVGLTTKSLLDKRMEPASCPVPRVRVVECQNTTRR